MYSACVCARVCQYVTPLFDMDLVQAHHVCVCVCVCVTTERAHQGHLQGTSARPEACDWGWAGWGGATPRRVSGLWGLVTDVALGGRHVLVMVE